MSDDRRVLLRLAVPRDESLILELLSGHGIEAVALGSSAAVVEALGQGAGMLLLAEETLNDAAMVQLQRWLDQQPPWSDVPVVVLSWQGADSPTVGRAMRRLRNVTVVERPARMSALLTAVRTALRARERQYEVRALLDNLHRANRRQTEFLATLAHELRNPLAPISMALEILRLQQSDPVRARDCHDMMRRQVDHMVRLVDDLMEVARITQGKVELRREVLRLQSVLDEAVELSRPMIERARHTLTLDSGAAPVLVSGDRVRLTQVVSNLLNNAAKYTPPGGRIQLRAWRNGDRAMIEVADSGIGLPTHMLDEVFEMFVQATDPAKPARAGGGLGVGLTLVKSLVELHGGSVRAASDGPGRGARFTVTLPAVAAQPGDAPAARDAPATAAQLSGSVMVVDDNRDAADSLADFLRIAGARVSVAYSGEHAVELVRQRAFDVAILDIGLPGMDGCDLARAIRAMRHGEATKLIALSGWGQESDRQRAKAAGFDFHLVKPVALDSLLALM